MKTKKQDETKAEKFKREMDEIRQAIQKFESYLEALEKLGKSQKHFEKRNKNIEQLTQETKQKPRDGTEIMSPERYKKILEYLPETQINLRGEIVAERRNGLEEREKQTREQKKQFRIKVGRIGKATDQSKHIASLLESLQNCKISDSQMDASDN